VVINPQHEPTPEGVALLLPLAVRVAAKQMLTHEACRFVLRAVDGGPLPAYTAGAHINVATPGGHVRSYSLTDDPADGDQYAITVHRDTRGRGGSVSLVDGLEVSDLVRISEPVNAFPLHEASRYLLIAGGIGITPLRSMLRSLLRQGHDQVRLLYLTRSAETTAYLDELTAPQLAGRVQVHHSDQLGVLDLWPYLATPGDTHLYVCGPTPLLDEVLALTMHWRPSAVHYERFTGVSAFGGLDAAFQVRWESTGEIFDVPADATLLDALRSAGKQVPYSCRSGICGTCRLRLVAGDVNHRDLVLTAQERRSAVMPCVSRAVGEVISVCL